MGNDIGRNSVKYKITTMKKLIFIVLLITLIVSCNGNDNTNHIDKYEVNIDSLKLLPDNFYGYRRGSIYIEDLKLKKYRVWFHLDDLGNIKNIFRIDNFKNYKEKINSVKKTYTIDTLEFKKNAQKFIELSRKYKFGHINIDRENKIYFSSKDGLSEQYVMVLNDSLKNIYMKNKEFKLLENGWFENIAK